jgi:hypothetical protein
VPKHWKGKLFYAGGGATLCLCEVATLHGAKNKVINTKKRDGDNANKKAKTSTMSGLHLRSALSG